MMRRTAVALGALVAFSGCATTTQIVSEPPGAKVHDKNGTELGTTPYTHESKIWLWESDELEVRKEGYQTQTVEVKRSEIDVVPTVGAAALFVCLGFVPFGLTGVVLFLAGGMKFPEETKVTLSSGGGSGSDIAPVPIACPAGLPVALLY